jgi:glycine cleavage system transcriptional repressor
MNTIRNIDVYAISVMSKDRIGIIANISEKIKEFGGDIADIRQSVLCGYFTMILIVSFPNGLEKELLEEKINEIYDSSNETLEITIKPVLGEILIPSNSFPENTYVLTVTGKDQIGFVASVTRFCSEKKINILDLSTTRKQDQYIMILFIDLSQSNGIDNLRKDLKIFSQATKFEVVLQHYNIFRAVNEIQLPVI